MTLRFIGRLPVLGYREVDGRDLAFAWHWTTAVLRVSFTDASPDLVGQVADLESAPRLVAAPDNLAWLDQDVPNRAREVIDHAVDLWHRKEEFFRHCDG